MRISLLRRVALRWDVKWIPAAEVGIYVEDTGKGIGTGHLNAIFDRFYKADEFAQGTGLGLSICKVIATRLSGRVEVQSQVGKGSRFTLVLPLMRNSEG